MNVRRRVGVELIVLSVLAIALRTVVDIADLPIWIGAVAIGTGGGLVAHDLFRADAGRPLWRWKWLDEGGPTREPREAPPASP